MANNDKKDPKDPKDPNRKEPKDPKDPNKKEPNDPKDPNKRDPKKKELKTSSRSSQRSIGMGASLRMASTDIRDLTREAENTTTSRLTPEGGSPPGESIFDCIAYIIHCRTHDKVVVSKVERAVWLPFIACPPNKTWKDASVDGVSIILQSQQDSELDAKLASRIPIKQISCLHVFRFQLPQKQTFITRLIQFVKLGKSTKTFKCCQNTKRIQWLPMNEVIAGNIEKVWGPELCIYGRVAKEAKPQGIDEYGLEQAFFYVPKDPPRSLEETMLKSLNIGQTQVEKLYSDFIEHCFPSFHMTMDSFKDYMSKYGYKQNDSRFPLLFNAFNYNKNGYLSFHELLLGLASMEPNTDNGEARIKFVFRYYDTDGDGFLSGDEFKKLVEDISPTDDENSLNAKTTEGMKVIGLTDNKIALAEFFKAIGSKTFRGTSSLCRSQKPVLSQISQSITQRTQNRSSAKKKARFLKTNRRGRGICPGCRAKKYEYGLHSVKLDTNGRCVEPRRIFEPESVDNDMNVQRYSMEYVFNTRSIAHSFVDLMKDFNGKKGSFNDPKGFMSGRDESETFLNYLQSLCCDLETLFAAEERVIKISSPACVVADIHGNLDDLLTMEKILWQQFPIVSANYVFLGNFIGKGKWSVESAVYLFSLKLIAPKKFILLRGNQEVREVQLKNTFQKECFHKYGEKLGRNVWDLINGVFDKLPLNVIIDESIFCTHSGIPISTTKMDDILSISSDLKHPEKESAIAWELMNNEPETEDNKKTGNGFDETEVKKFLSSNGFSHIIRGNQMIQNGYAFHFNGKCLSLFSCSHFCGQNNETAAVFVDSDRIRIIRLDTSKNPPATDPN